MTIRNQPVRISGSPALRGPRLMIVLALGVLYFGWGSTFLAIRLALESYPPLLMASYRYLAAGIVLYTISVAKGVRPPTRTEWINAAITGTMLLCTGNGLVCYAEQTVSSGMTAVALGAMPLFVAIFGLACGQRLRWLESLGLVVGLAGVLVLDLTGAMKSTPAGASALMLASVSWALGSVWSRYRDMPATSMNAAAQMLVGGVVLLAFGYASGEQAPRAPTLGATAALIYLVILGSLIGFSAYLFLLKTVRPALATSYAYVNPPVAVLIGALISGEAVAGLELLAMVIIVLGVVLVSWGRDRSDVGLSAKVAMR